MSRNLIVRQFAPLGLLGICAFLATYVWVREAPRRSTLETSLTSASGGPQNVAASAPGNDPAQPTPSSMVWIPGGEFRMGSDESTARSDEQPAHRVRVGGFWIDATEVTNRQFEEFVRATAYTTTAERSPVADELLANLPEGTPPPDPALLVPGSLVFTPPDHAVPLDDVRLWWTWTPGANWRHPEGPDSDLVGREEHPVVQVSWDDAVAYARWTGKRLPTEAEWEFAARGGLTGMPYVWGNEPPSLTHPQANLWTGKFPHENSAADGFLRTAPVGKFAANGYGLYDMSGNVWEWCSDWYDRELYQQRSQSEATTDPQGPDSSSDPLRPYMSQRSQRGGSFLCNDGYCSRYRPSARHGCTPDTGMSHVGFRCVKSP